MTTNPPFNPFTGTVFQGEAQANLLAAMQALNTKDPRFLSMRHIMASRWGHMRDADGIDHKVPHVILREGSKAAAFVPFRTERVAMFHASQIEGLPADFAIKSGA